MQPAWEASWAWGLPLIALTIAGHALGVVVIALSLERAGKWLVSRATARRHRVTAVAALIGAVGMLLAILHGIEAGAWAFAYVGLGAIGSLREAMLFSLDSLTTRGSTNLQLADHWLLMGALEAADGMLLFGISTAFVFAVLQRVMPLIARRTHRTD
jgi:hypothetical protein